MRIRQRKRIGPQWESEEFMVAFVDTGEHNPSRGKGPCFVRATEGRRIEGLPWC
jgi:hypothetical protein